jgi:hypothetical protein
MAVWYRSPDGAEIQRGDLEFSFILARSGSCAAGNGLSPDDQVIANMIIASFDVAMAGTEH